MKCGHCNGAIIYQQGNSIEPDRLVCMACGREPKGEEKKMEKRNCIVCGQEFEAKREKTTVCSKKCRNIDYNSRRPKINSEKSSKDIRNKSIRKPKLPSPEHKIDETILLDQQILKAIKKSVANQIIRIIEEAFA
jgi:endogenous inhibitor of DNA gyrase (YacG/DUF329 family)